MEFLNNILGNLVGEAVFATLTVLGGFLLLRYRNMKRVRREGRFTKSPDHKHTAYEDKGDIYVDDKRGFRNLTQSRTREYGVVWNQNSQLIAFQCANVKNMLSIIVADVEAGVASTLLTFPMPTDGWGRRLSWNGSGDLIVDLGGSEYRVKRNEIAIRLYSGRT